MEILKLPKNRDLYERHKQQARERTRRYRAKRRDLLLEQMNQPESERRVAPSPPDGFPFFQFAEVKLEEVSDDDVIFT